MGSLEGVIFLYSLSNILSPMIFQTNRTSLQNLTTNELELLERIRNYKIDILTKPGPHPYGDFVRPEVVESWQRSYNNRLKIFDYNYGPLLTETVFSEVLREKNILLKAADPYIRQMESILTDMESIILLSDENGVMLRVIVGSKEKLAEQNERFKLEPGSVWTERTVGTCAHGLSLILGTPMQICGPEHYCEKYEDISCSSAPIYDAFNVLAGTLSIVTPSFQHQSSHTLALALNMASAIQSLFQYQLEIELHNELLKVTFDVSDEGLITLNKNGTIIKANAKAKELFPFPDRNLIGMPVEEIIGNSPLVKSVLETGKAIKVDYEFKRAKQKLVLSSVKPLISDCDICFGCVLTINRIKELSKPELVTNSINDSESKYSFERIIGSSHQMAETIKKAKKIARLDDPVLIQGESGTGKELFAQAIHYTSRSQGPIIALNCAAIPKTLIESELFGYEGGAFTGAERQGRRGKIELANGGTLFLDEIGDMPLELQPVLLRVLEEKQVMRVGGSQYIPVDFRLIAATNKNLAQLVREDKFRADLYYRLAVYTLKIPSLRERRSDIRELLRYFLLEEAKKQQIQVPALSNAAKLLLYRYDWPGNVRQLKNTVMYAINMSTGGVIKPQDLPDMIREAGETEVPIADKPVFPDSKEDKPALEAAPSLSEVERDVIQEVLAQKDYCISHAAKALGMSRSTLYKKIKEYNLYRMK